MNEKLPQKYKNNIFHKIFGKIKAFLWRNKEEIKDDTDTIAKTEKNVVLKDKLEDLKVDIKIDHTEFQRKEFMQNLKENPELLKGFSTDRLEKILQYYLEENAKKRELLKKINT